MERIDVVTVGLAMSDRLLVGAFLDMVALTDGHVFRLCDYPDAPIVIFNPGDSSAAALLVEPKRGVAYIQFGMPEVSYSRAVWRLEKPMRLTALREIMIGVVEQRREWTFSGALAPKAAAVANFVAPPVPAHRKLEQVLGVLESIVNSRMPHFFNGIPGVEIVVFPLPNMVYIRCDPDISSWQKALSDVTHPVTAFSRIGARPMPEIQPISVAHFRWELARHLSAGMLLPGIANRGEFALTRWPDFGTMYAGSAYDLRIVALITTRPASIASMLRTVPYTREGVIALLNACALVGCMRGAPQDLLHSLAAQNLVALPSSDQAPSAAHHTLLSAPAQTPKRGFAGMLSKLRAALSFVPRAST